MSSNNPLRLQEQRQKGLLLFSKTRDLFKILLAYRISQCSIWLHHLEVEHLVQISFVHLKGIFLALPQQVFHFGDFPIDPSWLVLALLPWALFHRVILRELHIVLVLNRLVKVKRVRYAFRLLLAHVSHLTILALLLSHLEIHTGDETLGSKFKSKRLVGLLDIQLLLLDDVIVVLHDVLSSQVVVD